MSEYFHEGFEVSSFEIEPSPFALIDRKSILQFAPKYPFEFCIWVYLQTIPTDEFNIARLLKVFRIDKKTYVSAIAILEEEGLIKEVDGILKVNATFKSDN